MLPTSVPMNTQNMFLIYFINCEPVHDKTYNKTCATSKTQNSLQIQSLISLRWLQVPFTASRLSKEE